uniref:Fatty acyl-CoA reductase n=1 Tax=Anopheles culicifacies TaxID=139723 RepID=A0A182M4D7_9DIPT
MGDLRVVQEVQGDESGVMGVRKFYKESTILLTGGTGFIGKVLLEKLLRCFEVKSIYLLIRQKRNKTVTERLDEVFEDVIVFNVMASVKFNEDIETAIDTNVLSSRKLFLLAQQLPDIQSIVHVSTFYSNCHRAHIEERIYEDLPFGGFENILGLFRHLTPEEKDRLKPIILGPMPNSYTFSKRCAEVMIQQQFAQLPIAIFRPPIVTSAYREPSPGWVNNFNGPAGMVVPVIRGQVYWCYGADDATVHMVPVDYCVNALLAAGWENSERRYTIHITSSVFMRKLFINWLLLQACVADIFNKLTGKKAKNYDTIKRVVALEDSTSYFRCQSWTAENGNIRALWDRLPTDDRQLLPFDVETLDWKDYFRSFVKGVAAALRRQTVARQRMRDQKS